MIRVLIVVRARTFGEVLARRLSEFTRIEAEPILVRELRRPLAEVPDVVIVDAAARESLHLIAGLHEEAPSMPILALGIPEAPERVIPYVEAGSSGYLSVDGSLEDLVELVYSVDRGESLVSPRVAGSLLRRLSALAAERRDVTPDLGLTEREREVATLIQEGLSNKEIGQRLEISVATVKNHVHSVLGKLRIHRRGQIAARLEPRRPRRSSRN